MTCQPIAINVEKVISAWLDVMLAILIPHCTRRLQVLWMRSVRLPGEVKHRLLPQSELPWTRRMTDRIEITVIHSWINVYPLLPTSCWYICRKHCQFIFLILFSVSKLIVFFSSALQTTLWHRNIPLSQWFDKTLLSGQEKINIFQYIVMISMIYRQYFAATQTGSKMKLPSTKCRWVNFVFGKSIMKTTHHSCR